MTVVCLMVLMWPCAVDRMLATATTTASEHLHHLHGMYEGDTNKSLLATVSVFSPSPTWLPPLLPVHVARKQAPGGLSSKVLSSQRKEVTSSACTGPQPLAVEDNNSRKISVRVRLQKMRTVCKNVVCYTDILQKPLQTYIKKKKFTQNCHFDLAVNEN